MEVSPPSHAKNSGVAPSARALFLSVCASISERTMPACALVQATCNCVQPLHSRQSSATGAQSWCNRSRRLGRVVLHHPLGELYSCLHQRLAAAELPLVPLLSPFEMPLQEECSHQCPRHLCPHRNEAAISQFAGSLLHMLSSPQTPATSVRHSRDPCNMLQAIEWCHRPVGA